MAEQTRSSSSGAGRKGEATLQSGETGPGTPPGSRGKTTLADGVVAKIVGTAARDVPGIHALGGGLARTMGAVRDRVPGRGGQVTRGVNVEVGERQTAVDLDVVVEYGTPIAEIAAETRENVIAAVERMAGLEVVEVNIAVDDIHLPDEEDEEEEGQTRGRVR